MVVFFLYMVFLKLFLYTRSLVASQAQPKPPLLLIFLLPFHVAHLLHICGLFFSPPLSELLKCKTCGGDGAPVRSKDHLIIFLHFSLLFAFLHAPPAASLLPSSTLRPLF